MAQLLDAPEGLELGGAKRKVTILMSPVAAFSNLKLHFLRPTGEVVPGEMFAKVVETLPEDVSRVVVSFTSIPETARTFLDT